MLSLALNYSVSGLNAFSYHFLNLLLHLSNSVLVYIFCYRFFDKRRLLAFITALFFAIHPLHVESVAWVAERKDVLYAFFFLLGLIAYTEFSEKRDAKSYLLTMAAFVCSLLSKPAAVIFPVLLFALDYYKGHLKNFNYHLAKIPFFAASALIGWLTLSAQTNVGAVDTGFGFAFWQKFFFASYGLMMYLVKIFFPLNLAPFYPFPPLNQALPAIYYFSMLMMIALTFAVVFFKRNDRLIVFGLLFYLINLLLVLQIVSVGSAVIAERYTYLPYIGIFILAGHYFEKLRVKNQLFANALLIFAGLICSFLTFRQAKIWKNGETLWEHTLKTQESSRAYANRALLYKKEKNYEKALELYTKAVQINVADHESYNNRGNIYFELNKNEQAIAEYDKAISHKPDFYRAYDNRGAARARLGQFDLAYRDFEKAISLNPAYEKPYYNRGIAYMMQKKAPEAIADFEKYLSLVEKDAGIENSIGYCYQLQNEHEKAIKAFDKALQIEQNGIFYQNRLISNLQLGRKEAAKKDAEAAQRLGAKIRPDLLEMIKD
jgi:tetratricopeptide (TPR) repeat protein